MIFLLYWEVSRMFFVSQKLLASSQLCPWCGPNMELTETTRVNDGYIWRCTNKWCRLWLSIRSGSFLEGSNIQLSTWLHLMFLWAIQISGNKIVRLTSLSKPIVICALSELRTSTAAAVSWGKWGEVPIIWCEKLTLGLPWRTQRLHNKISGAFGN